MIRYCIANREHHLGGGALVAETGAEWRLPLRGPAVQSGSGLGYFPDGFIGGRLSCRITPHAPVTTVTIRGYCPRQHDGPVVLTCSIDGRAPRSEAVSPGSAFAIELAAAAATGRTMRLDIGSSRVMNPLERGESEDSRDLSVLILAVEVS